MPFRPRAHALALLLLAAAVAGARLQADDPSPLGTRLPVVLLHGWFADSTTWDRFARLAQDHPRFGQRAKLYRFGYDWKRPIRLAAEQLRSDLADTPELASRPLVLVGHSMGGLVARAFAEAQTPDLGGLDHIAALYAVATPNHGSPAANLGWLARSSTYSGVVALFPNGLNGLLNQVDLYRALRTEGGRDLGWDNYDGQMPPDVWLGEGRWLEEANRTFNAHPQRRELLLRYRLAAARLATVPALSLWKLGSQLRGGREYEAGGALLAHAFRDGAGHEITSWALNDGIVPLDSACWLQPGPALTNPPDAGVQARELRPGLVTLLAQGLDHSAVIADPVAVTPLLDQISAEDANTLVVSQAGATAMWWQGSARAMPVAAGEPLAVGRDRVIVRTADALNAILPEGGATLWRQPGATWAVDPSGRWALSDGWLLDLARPRLSQVPALTEVLWSPDGGAVAGRSNGHLLLLDTGGDAVTVDEDLWPVAWSTHGEELLAADVPHLSAAWLPSGGDVAVAQDATLRRLVRLDRNGHVQGRWPAANAAEGELRPRLRASTVLTWTADSRWLARLDRERARQLVLEPQEPGAALSRIDLGAEGDALAPLPDLRIVVLAHDAAGSRMLLADPAGASVTELARTKWRLVGPLSVSPDGRDVVAVWPQDELWVVPTDGGDAVWLKGARPLWLPQPAARRWRERTL